MFCHVLCSISGHRTDRNGDKWPVSGVGPRKDAGEHAKRVESQCFEGLLEHGTMGHKRMILDLWIYEFSMIVIVKCKPYT